ncbi:class I SAM-dependent methyltransferase [Crateriforma spongiae]|uniref:class I SAM-dependent methyltransferase n=1 Tax=Crateriforma spongiae TaxID=2724528 RepID=UPI001F196E97|nr:class I SAM-dependent methyltransferase [Crateriforma spongiae]
MALQRVLEPEIGESAEDANLYHAMDHTAVNQQFVDDLFSGGPVGPRVIDLGCGPGEIPILICRNADKLGVDVEVMGIDSDVDMLDIAKRELEIEGVIDRVTLQHADIKDLACLEDGLVHTAVSNTVAHHLAEPQLLLAAAKRLAGDAGRVFVRDLYRPEDEATVEALIRAHADGEPPSAQQLYRQSLHAALTLEEVRAIVDDLGMDAASVKMTSDRHWTLDWRGTA